MSATQAFIDAFMAAQLAIIAAIESKANSGNATKYQEALYAEFDRILRSLGVETAKWLDSVVPNTYRAAANETYRQLSMTPTANASFVGVNQVAVRAIIRETQNSMNIALYEIGRRINDQVREAAIRATARKLALNQTVQEMSRDLLRTFDEQGYAMGVADSRGRIMDARPYSEMVARSTTRETTNTATMEAAHSLDCRIFKLSTHYPTCNICAPRQGRVYRDAVFPEGDERNLFPHIAQAFPGWPEFKNIHPNCRHVLIPVGWDALSRETQLRYLADANTPFDVDPRSEKEIRAYNLGQAEKRMMRNDRRQWGRMRARLGDDAPKSFSAFRRIKYADGGVRRAFYDEEGTLRCGKSGSGEKWRMIQLDYRRRGELLINPASALPNAENASADDRKFTKYLFNPKSKDGWPKGVVLNERLGYNIGNWEALQEDVLARAPHYPATSQDVTEYGTRHEQRMVIYGLKGKPSNLIVGWMVRSDKTWMTTAYIKEVE